MSQNPTEPKIKTELKQHSDFTFDIQNDTRKLDNIIDDIEKYTDMDQEIDISNYIDPKKLKKIQDDYLKQLRETKNKNKGIETQKIESGKTIQKAETIGGSRTARKPEKPSAQKEIEKEAKEAGINQKELTEKLKNTIKQLEEEAEKLEKSDEFKFVNKTYSAEEIETSRNFLFNNEIKPEFFNQNGISTDKYISLLLDEKYSTKSQPKDSSIDSTPKQLVYISRLSKQLQTQLLQESNLQLKFNNIDMSICNYLRNKKINDYKVIYIILREFFKKLIIASLSDVELAFRSQNNWISQEFKKLILKDVIMLQTLPPKLAKSWKIFVNELCKTNDASIYNDISKLDYVLHIDCDFVVEETLAKSIKCMTPCFIYNYYLVAKSVYLLCGLLDDWFDSVKMRKENGDIEDKNIYYTELNNISKICIYLYENSRFHENSTARSLPYSNEPISQELQIYYLNHTIIGPQYKLLKGLEKYIYGLV